jgi:hypothetical protein
MSNRLHPGDLAVVGLILLFAWLGLRVHDSVAGLADMAQGIQDTGTSIQRSGASAAAEVRRSVGGAADAADQLPLVGPQVGDALRDTARSTASSIERESRATGAELAEAGREGAGDARETAWLAGWLAFLVPTAALLAQAVPRWVKRG